MAGRRNYFQVSLVSLRNQTMFPASVPRSVMSWSTSHTTLIGFYSCQSHGTGGGANGFTDNTSCYVNLEETTACSARLKDASHVMDIQCTWYICDIHVQVQHNFITYIHIIIGVHMYIGTFSMCAYTVVQFYTQLFISLYDIWL